MQRRGSGNRTGETRASAGRIQEPKKGLNRKERADEGTEGGTAISKEMLGLKTDKKDIICEAHPR